MDNMLNPRQDSQGDNQDNSDYQIATSYPKEYPGAESVPRISVHPPPAYDKNSYSSQVNNRDNMSSSTHRSSGSSSRRSSRTKSKKDDWSEITDPEERRRVQNKLAQRKFRDKAKESRERDARDTVNRELAPGAYTITKPGDLPSPTQTEGLPWGTGFSMSHIISRGQAVSGESQYESQNHGHSNDRSQHSQDCYSPYQHVTDTFEEHEYEEEAAYDQGPTWQSGGRDSYHQHYDQYNEQDHYYHDDGEQGGYGSNSY